MKIVLATSNPGKLRELASLLGGSPIDLISAAEVPGAPIVEEDQHTLRGNARKKAVALSRHAGLPALADDTGLEADALGGAPGVRSARFAGDDADDAANRTLLLQRMAGVVERGARFRTIIALADGDEVVYFEGTCNGTIARHERGDGGFGYDSVFMPEGSDRTFAEMSEAEKNEISHRGLALKRAVIYLEALLAGDAHA